MYSNNYNYLKKPTKIPTVIKSTLPKLENKSKIIPIPKTSNDHRSIAFIPLLAKVFEYLVHEQMYTYLNKEKLIHNIQSGYRAGHSFVTALLNVTDEIRYAIDQNNLTILTLLDHSKAFDIIDLPNIVKYCRLHIYADDVQLYISCDKKNLSCCINNLTMAWC